MAVQFHFYKYTKPKRMKDQVNREATQLFYHRAKFQVPLNVKIYLREREWFHSLLSPKFNRREF